MDTFLWQRCQFEQSLPPATVSCSPAVRAVGVCRTTWKRERFLTWRSFEQLCSWLWWRTERAPGERGRTLPFVAGDAFQQGPWGRAYLNFILQYFLCIAALFLGLVDLEVCAFLHVADLHVCFGLHFSELVLEAENRIVSVLVEETEAQEQAWRLKSAHCFLISPLPDKLRRDKATGFTLSLGVAPFQPRLQREVWFVTHMEGNKPISKEWSPLERWSDEQSGTRSQAFCFLVQEWIQSCLL